MLVDDVKLNALLLRIYNAALDDALWPSFMDELGKIAHAEDSLLFGSPDTGIDRPFVLSQMVNADSNVLNDYACNYWQHDIWKRSTAYSSQE
jgi:hypothetical protein